MGFVVESLVQALLPARCLLCRGSLPLTSNAGVCAACWQALPRLPEPACERCGEPSELNPCLSCQSSPPPWRRLAAVFAYEGSARELILLFKNGRDELARPCAIHLWHKARSFALPEKPTVTFVPMRPWRRLRRGYNQAELLATELAALASWPKQKLLRRVASGTQKGQSRKTRHEQVARAFEASGPAPERVMLVDDVVTTGATAAACTRALQRSGAKEVWVLALAKTLKR